MVQAAEPTFLNPVALDRSATANQDRGRLSREQFMKILVAELSNQNPLEPLDNSEFLGQIATLEQLSASTQVADGIRTLVTSQSLASASAFIGHYVQGTNAAGEEITGRVERILIAGNKVTLVTDQGSLALDQVTQVLDASVVEAGEEF